MLKYLSPTSLSTWTKDPVEFFRKYMCGMGGTPQTIQMSVGSAFDVFVKNKLIVDTQSTSKPMMFEEQVELGNREFAYAAGQDLLDRYVKYGGYSSLLQDMIGRVSVPRFESRVAGTVTTEGRATLVPLLGKPDLTFSVQSGATQCLVVHDWKVNGYCSNSPTSPAKGYMLCRDLCDVPSRSHGSRHALAGSFINHIAPDWAIQCATYALVLGHEDFIISIDQLVGPRGRTRLANFRGICEPGFVAKLKSAYADLWDRVTGAKPFFDRPDSAEVEAQLRAEAQACGYVDGQKPDAKGEFMSQLGRDRPY